MAGSSSVAHMNSCRRNHRLTGSPVDDASFFRKTVASCVAIRTQRTSAKANCSWTRGLSTQTDLLFRPRRHAICLAKAEENTNFAIEPGDKGPSFFGHDLLRVRKAFFPTGLDGLALELAAVALPAVLSQAVEPMAQLMDTAYVGRLGAVELAAVAVSVSIFNLVSKIFNIPLLNMTTSFVAADDAANTAKLQTLDKPSLSKKHEPSSRPQVALRKQVVPAVTVALFLAVLLAALESGVLALGGGPILTLMGVPMDSPMRYPAAKYLSIRVLGAPAMVFSLAVQGIFRGLKDTKTPFYAIGIGNMCNVLLSPILMFALGFGLTGASIATVASQYLMALLLLWNLSKRVVLAPSRLDLSRFKQFLKSGGFLLARTMALLFTMTLATSVAARQGATNMAAHQILVQIWLATSMLSDALALAGQALIATAYANHDFDRVKNVTFGILQIGLSFGLFMALLLSVGLPPLLKLFTEDAAVLGILEKGILFVAGTQPLNTLAFVFDGIHYGVKDFAYVAYSMILVGLFSSLCLFVAPSLMGLTGVWLGLTTLMSLRVVAGLIRLGGATGPWKFLRQV